MDPTRPCSVICPPLTSQRLSLSRGEPNFTSLGLLSSEKFVFNPLSKRSVNASRSGSLSNFDFLNLAACNHKVRGVNRQGIELSLCVISRSGGDNLCALVSTCPHIQSREPNSKETTYISVGRAPQPSTVILPAQCRSLRRSFRHRHR